MVRLNMFQNDKLKEQIEKKNPRKVNKPSDIKTVVRNKVQT